MLVAVDAMSPDNVCMRAAVEGIELMEQLLDSVPQIAVFDTSLRYHLPRPAAVYPGPYEWFSRSIRRYGVRYLDTRKAGQANALPWLE